MIGFFDELGAVSASSCCSFSSLAFIYRILASLYSCHGPMYISNLIILNLSSSVKSLSISKLKYYTRKGRNESMNERRDYWKLIHQAWLTVLLIIFTNLAFSSVYGCHRIRLTCFCLRSSTCFLSFTLLMRSALKASRSLYAQPGRTLVWSLGKKDLGDVWKDGHVTLSSSRYRYQVVFEAIRGLTYFSDIGLDDISFNQGACGQGEHDNNLWHDTLIIWHMIAL